MIRLSSHPTAAAVACLAKCKKRLQQARDEGQPDPLAALNCYRRKPVKESIVKETGGKCAYCESLVTHVYHGDVEHILPKALFADLRLNYDNLTFACAVCNNNKGNYFNEDAPILNPYADSPEDHLVAFGSVLLRKNGSTVGQRTIDLLDLNRLEERRRERIGLVQQLGERYSAEPDGPVKQVLANQLRDECTGEYAFTVQCYLRFVCGIDWQAL